MRSAPGYMATEMNTKLIEDPVRSKEILDRIPAKRWGTPEDMKGTAVFLASAAFGLFKWCHYPCRRSLPSSLNYLERMKYHEIWINSCR